MKQRFLALLSVLVMAGCSPKTSTPTDQPDVVQATDLGKSEEYFRTLYGAPKSAKQLTEFLFSLPGHATTIRLARPFGMQEFQNGKLKATVLYSGFPQRAVWVKYVLPDPWTQEQISAALRPYGSDWKIVQQQLGMTFVMGDRAPVAYRSTAGCLAYKTMFNDLTIYAPQLLKDLTTQLQETERQKQAVPKF